jgi:hypothetical protein
MSKFSVPRNAVAKFARDKRGNPIGLVCATQGASGDVTIGWSFVAKVDRTPGRISKQRSWEIALGRAVNGTDAVCPAALAPIVTEIRERATRYFRVNVVRMVGVA